jgi:hypothetical protein
MTDDEKKVIAETIAERKLAKAEILAELDKMEKSKFGVDVKTVLVTIPDVNDAGMRNNDSDGYDHTDKRLMRHFLPVNNDLGGFDETTYELRVDPSNSKLVCDEAISQMKLVQTWSPVEFDTTQTPPKDDRMPLLMGDHEPLDPRELPNLERYRLPEHLNIPNTPLKPGELMADLPFDSKYLPLLEKVDHSIVVEKDAIAASRKAAIAMAIEKTKLSNGSLEFKFEKHGSVGARTVREMRTLYSESVHDNKDHKDSNSAGLIMDPPAIFSRMKDCGDDKFGKSFLIQDQPLTQTVTLVEKGLLRGFFKVLVPGSKRKIVVYVAYAVKLELTDKILTYTAQAASKKGWKKVYLQRDEHMAETIEMVNLTQVFLKYYCSKPGVFIAAPTAWQNTY